MDESNLAELCRRIATATHNQHLELGAAGKRYVGRNAFGDRTLRADRAAEELILDLVEQAGLDAVAVTEEHGIVDIGSGAPQYTVFMDGLDGSSVYEAATAESIAHGDSRYGTMFAIYRGDQPHYSDALVSCIVEHPTGRLLIATTAGVWIELLNEDYSVPAQAMPVPLRGDSLIYCDFEDPNWGNDLRRTIVSPLQKAGYSPKATGCTARQYMDVATGKAVATIQWTRKGNLELACARQIINQAGGVVMSLEGVDMAYYAYDDYGHDPKQSEYFIAACSVDVAEQLCEIIVAGH